MGYICENCKKVFKGKKDNPNRFCSIECRKKFFRGSNHPCFKDGQSPGYVYKNIQRSIELLGNDCQICGVTSPIDLHHRDGNPANNPLDGSNWQRLCKSCHRKLHWIPKRKWKSLKEAYTFYDYLQKLKRKSEIQNLMYKRFGTMKYLTAKDICKEKKITRERVRQLRNKGRFKFLKIGGGFFYPPDYKNSA